MQALTLEQCHDYLLGILIDVDKFCRENGIRYSMAYGTLLGAVRHKGFIPWDDDIDLLMPRPDFERFIASYGRQDGARYRLLYRTDTPSSKFLHFFAKVEDSATECQQGKSANYKFGISLDIFPVDGKDPDKSAWPAFEKKMTGYAHRLNICSTKFDLLNFKQPLLTKISAHLRGPMYWIRKCDEGMKQFDFESSENAGAVSVTRNGIREVFPKKLFENYTTLTFEGHEFSAFSDWKLFLEQEFGDYMKLPPLNQRKTHSQVVYLK